MIYVLGYLAVGTMMGVVLEEQHYRRYPGAARSALDYVFSACLCAVCWPLLFVWWRKL